MKVGLIEGKEKMKDFQGADLEQVESQELKHVGPDGGALLREFMNQKGKQIAFDTASHIVETVGKEFNALTLRRENSEQEEIITVACLYIDVKKSGNEMGAAMPQIIDYCTGIQFEAFHQVRETLNEHSVKRASKIIAGIMTVMVFLVAEAIVVGFGMAVFGCLTKLNFLNS